MSEETKRIADALRHVGYGISQYDINCSKCPMQEIPNGDMECGSECPTTLMTLAADLIEELAVELEDAKERESGLSIMLTSAKSAAETWQRQAEAAEMDINMCCPCEVCNRSCKYDKVNPYDECADFEWRGLPKEEV